MRLRIWIVLTLLATSALAQRPRNRPLQPAIKPDAIKVEDAFIRSEADLVATLRKRNALPDNDRLMVFQSRKLGNGYSAMAFSPREHLLATSGSSRILLWNLMTGKEVGELPGYSPTMQGQTLTFSPDGKRLAVLDKYKLLVYNLESKELLKEMPSEHIGWHVAFSADGSTLSAVSGDAFGAAKVYLTTYNTKTFDRKQRLTIPNSRHSKFWNVSPSGNLFVHFGQREGDFEGKSDSVVILHLVTGAEKVIKVGVEAQTAVVAWDDRTIYFTAWGNRRLIHDDLYSLDLISEMTLKLASYKGFERTLLHVTTDGKSLMMRGTPRSKNGASLIDIATGKMRWYTSWYPFVTLSPGGSLLAGDLMMGGSGLFAMEDLLSSRWADLEEGIENAREKFCDVTLHGGRVRVQVRNDAKILSDLAKWIPSVTHLTLAGIPGVSEESFKALRDFRDLRELNLTQVMGLDDKALTIVGSLKSLRQLQLRYINTLTDAGIASLKGLDKLESLDLTAAKSVTDESLKHLGSMKSLRRLVLPDPGEITEKGIAELAFLDLHELTLPRAKPLLSGLRHLGSQKNLETLNVMGGKLSEDDLKALSQMTKLHHLKLDATCDLNDETLESLKGMTQLRSLEIYYHQKITGAGFRHLGGLKDLESLKITGTAFTDEALAHLKGMTALNHLALSATKVTDAGLEHLSGLQQLRTLELDSTAVKGAGLTHLKDCSELIELNLTNTRIDNEGLKGLKGFRHLRRLKVPKTITDAGLEQLEGLTMLEKLELIDCNKLRGSSFASLKKATPNLRTLVLYKSGINNEAIRILADMTQLRELYLGETAITVDALPDLKRMTFLKELSLPKNASLTSDKVQELRKALPKTWVMD